MAGRRVLSVGIIALVAAAFAIAALTQGTGWLFLASLASAASMLIVVVFLMAFSGERTSGRPYRGGDFGNFEEAARYALRGAAPGNSSRAGAGGSSDDPRDDGTGGSPRALVNYLVPMPRVPSTLLPGASRRELLDAFRKEGTGLIRLAKLTGVDVLPYQAFLADARRAALRGDAQATLRSLQLANELLRATIEKGFIKRKRSGERIEELDGL